MGTHVVGQVAHHLDASFNGTCEFADTCGIFGSPIISISKAVPSLDCNKQTRRTANLEFYCPSGGKRFGTHPKPLSGTMSPRRPEERGGIALLLLVSLSRWRGGFLCSSPSAFHSNVNRLQKFDSHPLPPLANNCLTRKPSPSHRPLPQQVVSRYLIESGLQKALDARPRGPSDGATRSPPLGVKKLTIGFPPSRRPSAPRASATWATAA